MKNSNLGFWRRFIAVFSPTFLSKLTKDTATGKSWGFWFLSNFFLLMIPTIALIVGTYVFFEDFPNNVIQKIPTETQFELPSGDVYSLKDMADNFELTITESFELETKNVPDPFIMGLAKNTGEEFFVKNIDEIDPETTEMVFVVDTKERAVSPDAINDFNGALFLLHDQFLVKNPNERKLETMIYSEVFETAEDTESPLPLTVDKSTIAKGQDIFREISQYTIGFLFLFAYAIIVSFGLLSALFWALVFWAIGAIASVPNWNFEKSLLAMLHFSFVRGLFLPLGLLVGLNMFTTCLIVLGLLFGANFYEMKRQEA